MTWCRLAITAFLIMSSTACLGLEIIAKGLTKNSAVFEVDGTQRLLRVGKTSPEGIRLISSNAKQAVIEYRGETQTLFLNKRIGAHYKEPEFKEVRLQSTRGNHYVAKGFINGRSVSMLVDTGATNVAMNESKAKQLGIDYKRGVETSVSTANGIVKAYNVNLKNVTIGSITVNNVTASVTQGEFPELILLGNSFLSRTEYRVEENIMLIQQKF